MCNTHKNNTVTQQIINKGQLNPNEQKDFGQRLHPFVGQTELVTLSQQWPKIVYLGRDSANSWSYDRALHNGVPLLDEQLLLAYTLF